MDNRQIQAKVKTAFARRLRALALARGNVPERSGRLRKSHVIEGAGSTRARLVVKAPYAKAVHDGRGKIVLRPKTKKAIYWNGAKHPVKKVTLPARKGDPWIDRAKARLKKDLMEKGLAALAPDLTRSTLQQIDPATHHALTSQLIRSLNHRGLPLRRL